MKEEEKKYILSQLDKVDDIGEISDGYHTFNSLYNQRLCLFAALVNAYKDKAWKSRLHRVKASPATNIYKHYTNKSTSIMNKEKVQAAMDDLKVRQDLFLISKLEKEYNELSDKCNKLYTYIYSLDFITKVPSCDERCLMQEQHKRMESYRTNLYQRIDFYRCRVKIACGYDILMSWSVVAERIRQFGVPIAPAKMERTIETLCGPVHLVNIDEQHHCGQDARVQYDPNESQPVNVPVQGDDCDDACCQARAGRVDHDAAHAASQTGESLQQLVGYMVLAVDDQRCDGCPYGTKIYNAPCVKLELVGGYFICLAPLPNSIITE